MNFFRQLAALIVTLPVTIAGCDRHGDVAVKGNAPVEVRLGFFPNLSHAQAVLGVYSGEFASALGSDKLSTKQFNAGPALIEALFANQIDIGYVGPGPAISAFARSRGEGIRVVSGAAANGVVIVARKDSGINTMADLVGKRVATPQPGNTQDIAAKHYLMTVLKQDNVSNVLSVANPEQSVMMAQGAIDASWAPEPWGARLVAETGAKIIGEEKDLWPDKEFSLTVIVVRPEFLSAHPEIIQKLLAAHQVWTARLTSEPQKYVPQLEQALASFTGKKLPLGVVEQAITRVKFTDEPLPATLETMARWTYELGFTKSKVNLDGLVDLTILRKLQSSKTAAN